MRCSTLAFLLGIAGALAGCDALAPPTCVRNSDCPTGQSCGSAGTCVAIPDAGAGDATGDGATATDAAATDAADIDAAAATAAARGRP